MQLTLRALPEAGISPVVIGPRNGKLAPWCRDNGIDYLDCELALRDKRHWWKYWGSVMCAANLLRVQKVDILHSNQIWSYQAAADAAGYLKIPRVCHFRDEADPKTIHWFTKPGVESVICISRHVEAQAVAAWPDPRKRPKLLRILNPVEPIEIRELNLNVLHEIQLAARRRFDIPAQEIVFGFVGQIREVKGVRSLIETCATLPREFPWRLLIAGKDPRPDKVYERDCRERAERPDLRGRVQFCGFLEEMEDFYNAIDVAVVPSLEEPMGRVPLEAASHARPTIAFRVGGLPDVVVDGVTGTLVPPEDWSTFRSEMLRSRRLAEDDLGVRAYQWVRSVTDPVKYAGILADHYRELLSGTAESSR
ncbi:MAG: glycosyltransferase family 4 protein [Planctomycetaceae bacterium]|nr:glycosyltransferase family 4 protein [Planctomycetaceae bacterium]